MSGGFKEVLFPIQVPEGDYCWDGRYVCQYYDNTGGDPHCELLVVFPDTTDNGKVVKPQKCRELRPVYGQPDLLEV